MTYLVVWATVVLTLCQGDSAEFGAGAADDLDRVGQVRFARDADGATADGVDGDVPETGARRGDARRKLVESAAVVGVASAILERAEVGVVHQSDVAGLRALDDDNVVFVEVLALVNEFHGRLQKGFFY